MKAGYERDEDVYVFTASFNSNVVTNRKLWKLYEEEQLGGDCDLSKLYLNRDRASNAQAAYQWLGFRNL